jgi:hypothetical protein
VTDAPAVKIISRSAGPVEGYTTVNASVVAGETGKFTIANFLIGTPAEEREIIAQSDARQALRHATKAGQI